MIIVLGSDGYIGAELVNYIDCLGVDSYYKRHLLDEMNIKPLYEVKKKHNYYCDIAYWASISRLIKEKQPEAIIDLAEQPSAPYSMIDRKRARDTIDNNLNGTLNLIYAIKEHSPQTHLIKLGTMGQFGTPNFQIEEGYMPIKYKGREDIISIPKNPYSIYHLSKGFDSDALMFASRVWGLRVTDLQQGFVHSISDFNQPSRFCYDGLFGTVLNRFMVQALSGHPLTVYGEGGQTRGVLHIKDTIECIKLAIENPANEGEYRVANQLTEWKSINEFAELVQKASKKLGIKTEIKHYQNPRKEKEKHFYQVTHKVMEDYGLKPNLLTVDMVCETMKFLHQYRGNINLDQIMTSPSW